MTKNSSASLALTPIEALEYSLLSAFVGSPELLAKYAGSLTGYKFHDQSLDWFWHLIRTNYAKTGEGIDFDIISANISILPKDQQKMLALHIEHIYNTTPVKTPRSAIDTLRKRADQVQLAETAGRIATMADQGDVEAAKQVINRAKLDNAAKTVPPVKKTFDKSYKPDTRPRIGSGFYAMDKDIGGLAVGENGLILATTGKGKSAAAVNIGFSAVRAKRRVLHIDTENGEHITRCRYISRFTGIPVNNILNSTMGPETQERYDTWIDRNEERLGRYHRSLFLDFHENSLTEVRAAIDATIRDGFVPDVIIFDSPDHIQRDKKESTWVEYADLINEAAMIPRKLSCSQWITSQVGMEYEDRIISTRGAANTSEKTRMANVVFSINFQMDEQSGRPKGDESLCLYLGKARSAKRGKIYPLVCDLSRMIMDCPVDIEKDGEENGF